MTSRRWVPRLVALDIDGTLLKWVEGAGTTHEEIAPAVGDAVRRARDAGCHVVLASGRSPHGMTPVADLLKLHLDDAEPLWIVASNGAVVFRYPPLEVVMEETFDAAPAVAAILERHPTALVAVEERGVGYRVTNEFPTGELSGEMIITEVADLVSAPVSRVIIRDPNATADDFVTLASELGLHGTDYVVGWTAWLDLAPVGVSKASGLAHVAEQLGVDAADVLAIGDGRNDIEMLEWAGRGVAMGQAVQLVMDAADDVTAPVAEDGAAVELGILLMTLPGIVDTERLRLPLWTTEDIARLRGHERAGEWHPAFPREDDRDAASMWHEGDPWGPRSIVLDGVVVGSIGFFGPPARADDDVPETEVGYGLVEEARGGGVATEALTALLGEADRAGVRVRASVRPDNAPSIRVLAKCGFNELRGSNEDGELVMARPPAVTLPELVATDLDGTLVDSEGRLSVRTRDVLDRLDAAGVPLVVVTARPLRWMTELWPVVGRHGVGIVSNGAIVFDVAEDRIHELEGIEVDAGLDLIAAIRAALPEAVFAFEGVSGFAHEPAYDEPHHIPEGSPSGPAEEVFSEVAVKVLVKAPGTDPARLRDVVAAAVGDSATPTWSVDGLVEISAAGVTKAAALARVCDRLGVAAADVVAFGDMPNDLPMLAWAGTSYAVANAHPSVLEAVDHVAPTNDEDGVAQVLAGMFDL